MKNASKPNAKKSTSPAPSKPAGPDLSKNKLIENLSAGERA